MVFLVKRKGFLVVKSSGFPLDNSVTLAAFIGYLPMHGICWGLGLVTLHARLTLGGRQQIMLELGGLPLFKPMALSALIG